MGATRTSNIDVATTRRDLAWLPWTTAACARRATSRMHRLSAGLPAMRASPCRAGHPGMQTCPPTCRRSAGHRQCAPDKLPILSGALRRGAAAVSSHSHIHHPVPQ